jgi:hypothetical protein
VRSGGKPVPHELQTFLKGACMKRNDTGTRILGRRLARQMSRNDMDQVNGSLTATYTLTYPPDRDHPDLA